MDSEIENKLLAASSDPDENGHVTWMGGRGHHGKPLIKHRDRQIPAAAAAFEYRTGRKPVGHSRADCGVWHCVAPDHVMDDIERRKVRTQLRALEGLVAPWDECSRGHGWDEHGRIAADLNPYCKTCRADRARENRERACKAEGTERKTS